MQLSCLCVLLWSVSSECPWGLPPHPSLGAPRECRGALAASLCGSSMSVPKLRLSGPELKTRGAMSSDSCLPGLEVGAGTAQGLPKGRSQAGLPCAFEAAFIQEKPRRRAPRVSPPAFPHVTAPAPSGGLRCVLRRCGHPACGLTSGAEKPPHWF